MNKVWLQGKAGKDGEVQVGQSGKKYVRFTLATERSMGEKKLTDWHNVTVIGDKARSVKKGDDVLVIDGKYVTDSFTDKTGNKRTSKGVLAFSMRVHSKNESFGSEYSQSSDFDSPQDSLGGY